jgi:hypothetical protein
MHPQDHGSAATAETFEERTQQDSDTTSDTKKTSEQFGFVFKPPTNDLLFCLDREHLGGCHGVLHAAGLRRFSDLSFITKEV